MAHEVENMLYVGETPWHGLGVSLQTPPANVAEAMKLAGLDWKVAAIPSSVTLPGVTLDTETGLIFRNSDYSEVGTLGEGFTQVESLVVDANGVPCGYIGDTDLHVPTEAQSIVRLSDMSVLGNVGAGYTPVQNSELFGFFDPVIEGGFVQIETAGSLRNGRRVWMLGKITNCTAEVVPGDPVSPYFLFSGSHDGTLPIAIGRTDIRVVCQNTLSAAHRAGKQSLLRVRHTKSVHESIEKIAQIIDWERGQFQLTMEQMRTLTRKPVTAEILAEYVKEVFKPEVEARPLKDYDKPYAKLVNKITPFFENGKGNTLAGVRGTMWAAYNSVTEYQTWERGRTNDARLDSLWFGLNAKTNARAFEVALKMAA